MIQRNKKRITSGKIGHRIICVEYSIIYKITNEKIIEQIINYHRGSGFKSVEDIPRKDFST